MATEAVFLTRNPVRALGTLRDELERMEAEVASLTAKARDRIVTARRQEDREVALRFAISELNEEIAARLDSYARLMATLRTAVEARPEARAVSDPDLLTAEVLHAYASTDEQGAAIWSYIVKVRSTEQAAERVGTMVRVELDRRDDARAAEIAITRAAQEESHATWHLATAAFQVDVSEGAEQAAVDPLLDDSDRSDFVLLGGKVG